MQKQEPIKIYPRTIYNGPGDEIIISGISGIYPNALDLHELEYNLYNKIDMVDDDERRWRHDNAEVPKRSGKIYGIEKFDATFFGVNVKQAHAMDPQSRILTEKAYEAILDAGINPKQLRGSTTGVFIGGCISESEKKWFYEKGPGGEFGIIGCSRAMLANRISYALGLQGPSFSIDSACSSTMYALDAAFTAMRNGDCDAALVGASNLTLHPHVTMQFARLGVVAANGMSRPFDANASGYVRSEAISVLLLQKSRDAKRIYSTVVYSKTNCDGYKEEGITYPSSKMQAKLLKEFYKEINIKPETVDYVEAHCTGTIVGDPEECTALDEVFCKNRKIPMPIGSVKSNIGHPEAASGMCSIAKCILAMENQLIPPNINFSEIHPTIKSLVGNRLQVVDNAQKLDGPLIAINSFGFGGSNAHCLLRAHMKAKINSGAPNDSIPRLVNWSGRTENACNTIHEALASQPLDVEHIALLHNTQSGSVPGNVFKSYGLYKHEEGGNAQCIKKEVQHFNGIKRPIVYVFSGMGSQWKGMGASLLEVPVFRQTIQKAHGLLKPKGLDLLNIITSPDEMFDNIVHSFVGIAAIQAALFDCLEALNIQPDYLIGHSVGELGCAYADNCLTMEEMVLCAYSRGMASHKATKIKGSMAAIGLSYSETKNLVPPTIDIACHNGPNSCTISGSQNEIEKFVDKLAADDIFASEVPCSNMAFHSRYIVNLGPQLLEYLLEIIRIPKKRSPKWLSTSVPQCDWNLPESQYCSAQYQTNNLLSPVLFEETSLLLPPNAILVEIAPHGLLQSILRKSLSNGIYIPLTQRDNKQNLDFFLSSLGRIYINGIDMAIENLYPKIEFPVSRGTGRISHLIKWDHTEDFYVMKYVAQKAKGGGKKILISLQNQNYEYISGYIVDGRCLFPETGYLSLVWETFGGINGKLFSDFNVQFDDVKFLRAAVINAELSVEFLVMIQQGTGRFEITEGGVAVVTGYIKQLPCDTKLTNVPFIKHDYPYLQTKDFYKELRLRGYHYNGLFRNVIEARSDGLHGRVRWDSNWVSFMHSLLQIVIFGRDTRCLLTPTRIEQIIIDTKRHKEFLNNFHHDNTENQFLEIFMSKHLKICQAGGIEIKGLQAKLVARRRDLSMPVIDSYKFIPYLPTPKMSELNAARICIEHALENQLTPIVKCVELLSNNTVPFIIKLKEAIEITPIASADLIILTSDKIECDNIKVADDTLASQTNCLFIVKSNCLADLEFFERSKLSLLQYGYIISRERANLQPNQIFTPDGFNLVAVVPLDNETIVLLQNKSPKIREERIPIKISLGDKEFKWLEPFKTTNANEFLIYSQNEPFSGIIGLVKCIRKEPNGSNLICVFIDDQNAPPFAMGDPFYKNQLALNFAINVFRNGQWGSYRHLSLDKLIQDKPYNKHICANLAQSGDLTSLRWLNGSYSREFADKQTKVQFAALNFRDVKLGVGKQVVGIFDGGRLEQEFVLGNEYSGIDRKGNKIMGMAMSGSIGSHIISDPELTWECPKNWSLEQAATVPMAYSIVYTALIVHAQIKKGNSILIHAGTGGVGLAAIKVALAYGLTVFTTVSSTGKREFLLKTFSELKGCHIGNTRNLSFERMIKVETNGAGVDYVLNSLADEKLHASLRCLRKGGKFIEIAKPDMPNDIKIGIDEVLKEITFHVIVVDNLFTAPLEEKMVLQMLLQRDIDAGIIQPLPATVFAASDIEDAFRFLASAKHVGKVLLKIREDPYDDFSLPIKICSRICCPANASYVVVGGLGGFGLELIDWLIRRGARNVIISARRGISKPYQSYRIKIWESYGAVVKIIISNIGTEHGCETILKEALKLGPIAGVFNLAADLDDGILENQTAAKFIKCFTSKVYATIYLDQLSRKLCPTLQHFVAFSSVTSARGNPGQTNYGMANSIMERIIEQRYRQSLPGKVIQWGAIGDVGLLAEMQEEKHDIIIAGSIQQKISSCLEHLDYILLSDSPIISSMVIAEKRAYANSDNILSSVMNIMTIRDVKSISMNATLTELGMDSLMAVEIKQTLERDFDIILSLPNLRKVTFDKLNELNEQTKQPSISGTVNL